MSNSFTKKNIESFLAEQGAPEATASAIANYVVVAVRTTSTGAEITAQSVAPDFAAYSASLLAADHSKLDVEYKVKKLGAGFFEHGVTVLHDGQSYGLSNLVHAPLGLDVDVTEAKEYVEKAGEVVEEVKELVEELSAEVAEFVEEVKEIFAEETAPVVVVEETTEEVKEVVEETPTEEVKEYAEETSTEEAKEEVKEVVEETSTEEVKEEVAAAAPAKKAKKGKKAE